MPSLIHLTYASVATGDFDTAQLTELLQQSRRANELAGLTGMLLYSDGNFFQLLEGEPAAVDALYAKLHLDKRHKQLTLIIREPIPKRDFADWSMGFSNVSPKELMQIAGLNDFFGNGSCFTELNAGRAKKLLAAFAKGRWPATLINPKRPGA
jgi:hypothetical protein